MPRARRARARWWDVTARYPRAVRATLLTVLLLLAFKTMARIAALPAVRFTTASLRDVALSTSLAACLFLATISAPDSTPHCNHVRSP